MIIHVKQLVYSEGCSANVKYYVYGALQFLLGRTCIPWGQNS